MKKVQENMTDLEKQQEEKYIIRVRTRNNLLDLLKEGKSAAWKVGKHRVNKICKVQIINWDGTQMLESSYDTSTSERIKDGRLIIAFSKKDARIVNCDPAITWRGENPVNYMTV